MSDDSNNYDDGDFDATEILGSIERLTKDLKNAAVTLSEHEVRFLVDAYYAMQKDRIRGAHQTRTLAQSNEPHTILSWLTGQRGKLEKQIARAMDVYSDSQPAGRWARSIVGIGPIISSGLIANIYMGDWCSVCHGRNEDIHNKLIELKKFKEHPWQSEMSCPTVGHIWNYAGLNPDISWERGQKRPWNGSLKRLSWIIGESFVKVSGRPNDVYGKMYQERKAYETAKNDAFEYAEQAKAALTKKRFGDDTIAKKFYLQGLLPPGHLHSRAKRYCVKIFLSHLHYVMFELKYGKRPPKPFAIEHLGHTHEMVPPNWPIAK